MRIKREYKHKYQPKDGELRERHVFLLFPKTDYRPTNYYETRWLEFATLVEKYSEEEYYYDGHSPAMWIFVGFKETA